VNATGRQGKSSRSREKKTSRRLNQDCTTVVELGRTIKVISSLLSLLNVA